MSLLFEAALLVKSDSFCVVSKNPQVDFLDGSIRLCPMDQLFEQGRSDTPASPFPQDPHSKYSNMRDPLSLSDMEVNVPDDASFVLSNEQQLVRVVSQTSDPLPLLLFCFPEFAWNQDLTVVIGDIACGGLD